jgi:hypothetical protein
MKKMIALILIVIFSSVGSAYGQSAKDALEALKNLQAKTKYGFSTCGDYSIAVVYTNSKVDKYLKSKDSYKDGLVRNSIDKALYHYLYALGLWKIKLERGGAGVPEISTFISKYDGQVYNKLITEYPNMSKALWSGQISIDLAIPIIWAKASEEIQQAQNLINRH